MIERMQAGRTRDVYGIDSFGEAIFMADRMPRRQERTFILSIEIILILLHRI